MSSGGGTQTSTQKTEIPAYIQDAQQNTLATAQRFTEPFLQNPPSTTVAGFSPDQQQAFSLSRLMAQNAFATPTPQVPNTNAASQFVWPSSIAAAAPGQILAASPIGTYSADPHTAPGVSAGGASITTAGSAGPAALMNAASAGQAANTNAALAGPAANVTAAAMDPAAGVIQSGDAQQWMNPFTNAVLDPTLASMRRELGKTHAGIDARNASAASFGGSRAALQNSEADRAYGDQAAQVAGNLNLQGYNTALQTALTNAARAQGNAQYNAGNQQQAGLANAAAQNNMGQFNAANQQQANLSNSAAQNAMAQYNAGLQQNAGQINAGAHNNMAQYNANLLQNTGQFNAGALNNMAQYNANLAQNTNQFNTGALNANSQFNANQYLNTDIAKAAGLNQMNATNAGYQQQANLANASAINNANSTFGQQFNNMLSSDATRALTGSELQNTFANDEARRQATALQQLLGTGATQQANEQQNLSQPLDMLRLLQQSTPGNIGTTQTTTQPTQSNPIGTLAGLASIASLFMPSDRRDKTDIKKLGKDSQSGLDIYAYRYKGDPKSNPKVAGPMAQDVEKQYPGTVHEIGGHKVIDMHALLSAVSEFQGTK